MCEEESPPPPQTLQDLCVRYICDHVDELYVWDQFNGPHFRTSASLPDYYIHGQLSEKLLQEMSRRGHLCDRTLSMFDHVRTRLERASLPDASRVSPRGIGSLRHHRLKELHMTTLKCGIDAALEAGLGEWSRQNLRVLRLKRCRFNPRADMGWSSLSEPHPLDDRDDLICHLKELRFLDLSDTDLACLRMGRLARGLPHLQHLDISKTRVDDLAPLHALGAHLRSLSLRDLRLDGHAAAMLARSLPNLTHMDVSSEAGQPYTGGPKFAPGLVHHPLRFPNLVWLDMSGRDCGPDWPAFESFLAAHPKMVFLGLLGWEICEAPALTEAVSNGSEMTVAGSGTESQLRVAMKMYMGRPAMLQRCLYSLFKSGWVTPHLVNLLADGAEAHPDHFSVQVAATACFYNMTRGSTHSTHPNTLGRVIRLTLDAMEAFPSHFQLQKNSLLTLCSDRVLQDANFDRLRAARLVLEALCAFEDPAMTRMAVAVTSILAAKVNTPDSAVLGRHSRYVGRLLAIVRTKAVAQTLDVTAKFALSALWNLTDESAVTCQVFLAQEGLELFQLALEAWQGQSGAETKLLGLLNNVAEVASLRPSLLGQPGFVSQMFDLLRSPHIDVSYFAAGVLAHLASDGAGAWLSGQPDDVTRVVYEDAVADLAGAVSRWQAPDGEMVAYRSFRPFIPLLAPGQNAAVQLWATWAVHHVCTRNVTRYCPMLVSEGGHHLLASLLRQPNPCPWATPMCYSVLKALCQNRLADPSLLPPSENSRV